MKTKTKYLVGSLVSASLLNFAAKADIMVTVTQVGPSVLASYSGTLDLESFSSGPGRIFVSQSFFPEEPNLALGGGNNMLNPSSLDSYSLQNLNGPSNFGVNPTSDYFGISPDQNTGMLFSFSGSISRISVSAGYSSNALISGSSTWDSTTLGELGLAEGTYHWTWSSPTASETLTLQIVPEQTSYSLILGIMVLCGTLLRRKTEIGSNLQMIKS